MDFGTLLHVAKKNSETSKNESKYYSTKFAPPKKESKEKKLSENIQKFLQKREQEERERQRAQKEKVDALLSSRDEKSKNKIRKMLKVTKSANKSVLEDAINKDDTAVTLNGADQPDQDDYGYVSVESNAFYAKYLEKVKDVKEDKGFAPSRPQSLHDLGGTKERVKAALTREIEEKRTHTRQRTSTVTSSTSGGKEATVVRPYVSTSSKHVYDAEAERREEERKKKEEETKKARARRPAPPPMDFQALLKLAEQKQHEPVAALQPEPKKRRKEPERLLTMQERREAEERQRWKDERGKRDRERAEAAKKGAAATAAPPSVTTPGKMEPNGRIPKLNQAAKQPTAAASSTGAASKTGGNGFRKPTIAAITPAAAKSSLSVKSGAPSSSLLAKSQAGYAASSSSSSAKAASSSAKPASMTAKPASMSAKPSSTSAKPSSASAKPSSTSAKPSSSAANGSSSALPSGGSRNPYGPTGKQAALNGAVREFPPRDVKTVKARQFPPADVQKTRQFPPADVRRGGGAPSRPHADSRRPPPANNKRILDDDDDDSEYDSELDDFIDDGDCEEDISSHIKSIFGYDKSKYRHLNDDDDRDMESNFAQQQREEFLSKKAGMKEDLEDMKMEAMEKKRKMSKKRRLLSED